ncbi:thiopeptide-type bacteriocin biosynthesis protein [Actinokineospora sp. HUAS TT18]|uniref:thiopeptide-type bacteriocin biosynthesis protein n=1 Tax=Actinokineospora sp. HUAS TT18 TaxID=3447451 RepID=UPI003F51E418
MHPEPTWAQAVLHPTDYSTVDDLAVNHLQPLMTATEGITAWWFIRKSPTWRVRWLPTNHDAIPTIHRGFNKLVTTGHLRQWTNSLYEPETHAFGGEPAMNIAYTLFHHDTQHILDHLTRPLSEPRRPELTILLCASLMRGAGLDWYEQGDTWARIATNRPSPTRTLDTTAMRRLLTADTRPSNPSIQANTTLAHIAPWLDSFHTTGQRLHQLDSNGLLHRGLRAVLAHHMLFHWNRLGLNYQQQSTLAHTARDTILD